MVVATRSTVKAEPAEEKGGNALLLLFTAIFFAAYTYFQNVSATPPGGAPATGRFYSESTYALPAAATSIYLLVVLLGPRLMARREAFNLKGAMLVYNAFQTAFNVFTVALFVAEVRASGMRAWGNVVGPEWIDEPKYGRLIWGIWLHYNNKYLELLDSVFMILRKKTDQLSFLHVYHHCLLVWAWLLVMKVMGCPDCYFGACANATIHVIMYSYYLMASLGIACPWKKYITQAQLLQFCIVAGHSLYALYTRCCPAILPYSQLFVMLNMLYLFGKFYAKSYKKKDSRKKGE